MCRKNAQPTEHAAALFKEFNIADIFTLTQAKASAPSPAAAECASYYLPEKLEARRSLWRWPPLVSADAMKGPACVVRLAANAHRVRPGLHPFAIAAPAPDKITDAGHLLTSNVGANGESFRELESRHGASGRSNGEEGSITGVLDGTRRERRHRFRVWASNDFPTLYRNTYRAQDRIAKDKQRLEEKSAADLAKQRKGLQELHGKGPYGKGSKKVGEELTPYPRPNDVESNPKPEPPTQRAGGWLLIKQQPKRAGAEQQQQPRPRPEPPTQRAGGWLLFKHQPKRPGAEQQRGVAGPRLQSA
eukprot:g3623.t1